MYEFKAVSSRSSYLSSFLSFFVNNMKRTHQVRSWNAMLTPCLANHARTDLIRPWCGHGFKAGYILSPRSQLWSIAKPRGGTGRGRRFKAVKQRTFAAGRG